MAAIDQTSTVLTYFHLLMQAKIYTFTHFFDFSLTEMIFVFFFSKSSL